MSTIRILLGFLRPFAWAFPALLILGLFASLAEGIGIGMLIPLLDLLLQRESVAPPGFVGVLQSFGAGVGEQTRLALIGASIAALILAKSLVLAAFFALSDWINAQVGHHLRTRVYRQYLEVDFGFIASRDPGRLFATLDNETYRTTEALTSLAWLIISICTVVVFLVLLVLMSLPLTLVVFAGVLAVSLGVRLVTRPAERVGSAVVQGYGRMHERIWSTLGGMRLIRVFGQEAREQSGFDAQSKIIRRGSFRLHFLHDMIPPVLEVLYMPVFLAAILYAWYAEIGVPTLIAFLLLTHRLQPHAKRIDQCRVRLATLSAAVNEVAAMLARHDKPYLRSGSRPFTGLREGIVFDGVDFRYRGKPGAPQALREISFEIPRSSVTAVVGASGSGKSTLVNLLCRLYDPCAGEIRIDGVPLPELDLAAWRCRIGLAGQDLDLLPGTIRDNIAYGCPSADDAAIEAAARDADAHDFITALPAGYDTPVGDRGLRLSGGQRQRIGLARALLRRPEVLILDEATNALDSLSETAIQGMLARMSGQVTLVVIAHRLSTIRNADQVIVLAEGRIIEQGPPQHLLEAGQLFAQLSELQGAAANPATSSRSPAPAAEPEPSAELAHGVNRTERSLVS